MKKSLLAVTVLAGFLSATSAFAQVDNTVPGKIYFKGTVSNAACTLAGVKDVELGFVSKKTLAEAGKEGPAGQTTIEFLNCNYGLDAENEDDKKLMVDTVTVTIQEGAKDPVNENLWKNSGNAQNVGIEITHAGTVIKATEVNEPLVANGIKGNPNPTFTIGGKMVATGAATEGDVHTTLNFIATYK